MSKGQSERRGEKGARELAWESRRETQRANGITGDLGKREKGKGKHRSGQTLIGESQTLKPNQKQTKTSTKVSNVRVQKEEVHIHLQKVRGISG